MDISSYRPRPPDVLCSKCRRRPDLVSDTALHINLPPTKHGIVLIQVKCHGETQNIAATFRWIKDHPGYVIFAFQLNHEDYGLKDMVALDGFSLPKDLEACAYQLEDAKSPKELAEDDKEKVTRVIDEVFEQAIKRRQRGLGASPFMGDTEDARGMLVHAQASLSVLLFKSEKQAISTSEITDAAAYVAETAQRIFLKWGTPRTQPKKMIYDIYDNDAKKPSKHLDCVGTEGCKASVETTHLIGER